jgi:hypothetical protein
MWFAQKTAPQSREAPGVPQRAAAGGWKRRSIVKPARALQTLDKPDQNAGRPEAPAREAASSGSFWAGVSLPQLLSWPWASPNAGSAEAAAQQAKQVEQVGAAGARPRPRRPPRRSLTSTPPPRRPSWRHRSARAPGSRRRCLTSTPSSRT